VPEQPRTKKKVVAASSQHSTRSKKTPSTSTQPTWHASPEAQAQAKKLRLITWILWIVALGVTFFVAFWVLRQNPVNMWLLIAMFVVAGALVIPGNLMWKKANVLDPASEKNKVKFFVQNQLGAIVSSIAFLPMIILLFMNKNMDGKQKGIAGAIAILIFGGSFATGISTDPPSVEKYSDEQALVIALMGKDEVYWTTGGSVFHLCEAVSDLQHESQSNEIVVGTVSEAHDAGKSRLTKKVKQELSQCGLDPALYDESTGKAVNQSGGAGTEQAGTEETDTEQTGTEETGTDSSGATD